MRLQLPRIRNHTAATVTVSYAGIGETVTVAPGDSLAQALTIDRLGYRELRGLAAHLCAWLRIAALLRFGG